MGKRKYKKRAPRPKLTTPVNGFDLKDIEPIILENLLTSFRLSNQPKNEVTSYYEDNYRQYITEVFSSRIISLIITFAKTSQSMPVAIIQDKQFYKNIISIIKELMMNEIEIALFTLYIDDLGWTFKGVHYLVHILFTGILTKEHCNQNIELIMSHFQKQNPFFIECYHEWRNKINEENYTNEEINERFSLINKPYNSYCPFDYMDLNCIVDSIITLSQPYGERSNSEFIKEDKIVDLVKRTSLNPLVELPKMKYTIGTNLNSTTAPTDNINGFNNINIQISNNDISKETSNIIDALSSLQKSNDISNSFNNDVFNLIYPNLTRNNNIKQNDNSNLQKGSPIVKDANLSIFGFFPPSSQTQKGFGNSQEQNTSFNY